MKHNREFEIAWLGLKVGEHVYDFSIGDEFMQERGAPPELHDWAAQVKLRFDRQPSFFRLHFDVSGSVVVPCDRCGDDFTLSLWDEFDLLVKINGDEDDDAEPDEEADVAFISRNESVIDSSSWIYEFVMLSLPLQRVHPDNGCNPAALRLLNELSAAEDAAEHGIWKGLKNITIADENAGETDGDNKNITK